MSEYNRSNDINLTDAGSMTIEMVVSFLVFMAFVGFMVNLINVYSFHNRMQYALNAAAHEISSLSYGIYTMTGLRDFDKEVVNDGSKHVEANNKTVDSLFETYQKFHDISLSISEIKDFCKSAEESYELVKDRTDNIDSTLIGLLYFLMEEGQNAAKGYVGGEAAKRLVPKYLEVIDSSFSPAYTYEDMLNRYYIVPESIDYGKTEIFSNGSSVIKLAVEYDVNVGFFDFSDSSGKKGFITETLGEKRVIHVVQCAVVSGWNDGDGKKIE